MIRPWHTWAAFCLCLAVVLGGMGWVSATALRLDRAGAEARRLATLEENIRLALWRMDSALAPLIARENARPYFAYSPFYPAERAYNRMFAEIRRGEVLVPSPLLTEAPSRVLLHFQLAPGGQLTSPQAPTGNMRDLAETGYTTHEKVLDASRRLEELRLALGRDALTKALSRETPRPQVVALQANVPQSGVRQQAEQQAEQQVQRSQKEWQARAKSYQQAAAPRKIARKESARLVPVREGVMRPVWVGTALVLARRVAVADKVYLQGCWLDWPSIREWLIEDVKEMLPGADLTPVAEQSPEEGVRMLAALPVRLVPGEIPADPVRFITPIRFSLGIAWVCVLLAAAAVAVLLLGAVSLSERRGAFVSAVTHELRTPLTTFRMYTEMLVERMVPDEEKRRLYLNTLRIEADRLSHLVENVLAYARLERGRAARNREDITVGDLIERSRGRLSERAGQAGMVLAVEADEASLSVYVHVDASAVEQILFNLVDNASKYASGASDRRIHVIPERGDTRVLVSVRDHGPGVSGQDARRLFRPFSKSAREAANSAPGVGLGLALSRRLARSMGGDLRLDRSVTDGACFALTVPVSTPATR